MIYSEIKDHDSTAALLALLAGAGGIGTAIAASHTSDTLPPAPPVSGGTSFKANSPSVADQSGNPINPGDETQERQPKLSGTADDPGSTIIIYDNDVPVGEVTPDPVTGAWTWTLPADLDEGDHSFTVVEKDPTGNESPKSPSLDFTVDVTPPTALSNITSISDDTGNAGDFITSDQTLVIHGSVTAPLASGERVQIRVDGGAWQNVTDCNNANDTWKYDNSSTPLSYGSHVIEVRTIDEAGNATQPDIRNVEIDIQPNMSAVVSIAGFDDDVAPGVGTGLASGSWTNDALPPLKGTFSGVDVTGGDQVSIRQNGVHVGYALLDATTGE